MERLFDPARPHFAAWVWLYDVDHHLDRAHVQDLARRDLRLSRFIMPLCAVSHGLVEHLIDAHSPDVNSRGGSHTTALHAAAVNGHSEVASLLLRNGANPNSRDQQGRTSASQEGITGRTDRHGEIIIRESRGFSSSMA